MSTCRRVAALTDKNNEREQIETSREGKLDGDWAEIRAQTALFSGERKMDQSR